MQSRRSNSTRSSALLSVGVGMVIGAVFFIGDYATSRQLSGAMRSVLLPLPNFGRLLGDVGSEIGVYFTSKKSLADENALLRTRVSTLELSMPRDRLAAYSLTSSDALDEAISNMSIGMFASARPVRADVVSYTAYPLGTLTLSLREASEHTQTGQTRYVFDEHGAAIGLLDALAGRTALVRLFSRAGEEHHMRVGESEFALVRGLGGVTMEAVLPKSTVLTKGDPVSLPEAGNALVGVVGEVTSDSADTTQHVLIRLASSPRDIRTVFFFDTN
jgi:hypothetical protein